MLKRVLKGWCVDRGALKGCVKECVDRADISKEFQQKSMECWMNKTVVPVDRAC